MVAEVDSGLQWLLGSRTRLLTMAVLANADEPLTGYRIAKTADLPRIKVYAELRNGVSSELLAKVDEKYLMVDPDVRALLRKRVKIRWDEEWDRARVGWNGQTSARLAKILASMSTEPEFLRPRGWRPTDSALKVIREIQRPPTKDAVLERRGLRTSAREDWQRGS
jgi:hypothetical protein